MPKAPPKDPGAGSGERSRTKKHAARPKEDVAGKPRRIRRPMGSEAGTMADVGPPATSKSTDTVWDYLTRGRRFEYMETAALKAMWVSIVRKMAADPMNRGLLLASSDLDMELQIRGDDPRYGDAKADIDAYLRNLSAAISNLRKTDPDEWKRATTEMTADVEHFMEQTKALRLSRELSGRRLSTWPHGRKSGAGVSGHGPQPTAVRRERSNGDAGRQHVPFRDRAESH
jgi:hypothetical protein